MTKQELERQVRKYYPENISVVDNRSSYLNSSEYRNLRNLINDVSKESEYKRRYGSLITRLRSTEKFPLINDVSRPDWDDRCFTLEFDFIKEKSLVKICLHLSLLIPSYVLYIVSNRIEVDPYRWVTLPKRNQHLENEDFHKHLDLISELVQDTMGFTKFPDQLMDYIIPEVAFQDIRQGEFTFYNAFFLNENKFMT